MAGIPVFVSFDFDHDEDLKDSPAADPHRGVCGVRLKDSRGRAPETLTAIHAPIAQWGMATIVAAIEAAAARCT
jgi:hypothetical protein